MKNSLFCILFLIALCFPLFAQETAPDVEEGARKWKSFPYSLGAGIEYGLNTREKFALGYGVALDRYLNTPYVSLGLRGTMYTDFRTITSSEAELTFRLYFADAWIGGFFAQLGFGAAFYREEERKINTYIMDLTMGYKLYFQKNFLRGFYLEPYFRFGYPFQLSFGIFAGHWLNF